MKTKEEILKEYSNKKSYDEWYYLMYNINGHEQIVSTCEVMEIYATQQLQSEREKVKLLMEALHDLRYGVFEDADAVNEVIDKAFKQTE